MSDELAAKKCVPCEGGVKPLDKKALEPLLAGVSNWTVTTAASDRGPVETLQKRFEFENFRKAMAFLRDVEELAEKQGHHPDFCVHYNRVDFTVWTHAISGLHQNDFIIAAGIDRLAEKD